MDDLGKWLIGIAVAVGSTVSGWLIFLFRGIRADIASNKSEIDAVKSSLGDKVGRTEFITESDRRRQDTIKLHEKIDAGQKELRDTIRADNQRMDDKLDRILEKIK